MGSAGSEGLPCTAFRVVIEHEAGHPPTVAELLEALQDGVGAATYIEVHPAGSACEEVGHLIGDPCPRCKGEIDA